MQNLKVRSHQDLPESRRKAPYRMVLIRYTGVLGALPFISEGPISAVLMNAPFGTVSDVLLVKVSVAGSAGLNGIKDNVVN